MDAAVRGGQVVLLQELLLDSPSGRDHGVRPGVVDRRATLAAPCSIDELATLARTRLKRIQCQPGLLDGFITETGLITAPP